MHLRSDISLLHLLALASAAMSSPLGFRLFQKSQLPYLAESLLLLSLITLGAATSGSFKAYTGLDTRG